MLRTCRLLPSMVHGTSFTGCHGVLCVSCTCSSSRRVCSCPSVPMVTVTRANSEAQTISARHPRSPMTSPISRSPTLSPVDEMSSACSLSSSRARRPPHSLSDRHCSYRSAPYDIQRSSRSSRINAVERRRRRRRLRGVVSDEDALVSYTNPPPSPVHGGMAAACDGHQDTISEVSRQLSSLSDRCPSAHGISFGGDDVFSSGASSPVSPALHSHGSPSHSDEVFPAPFLGSSSSAKDGEPPLIFNDTTPNELACYLQDILNLPKEMSEAAKQMYR